MRKRAQWKSSIGETTPVIEQTSTEKKRISFNKNWWIAVSLIAIFFLVLLLNTYFNVSSGYAMNPNGQNLSEKFYLAGPDPYYNMRLVNSTVATGQYPYYATADPILAYPIGRSGDRGPLMNMMAIGFSKLLTPFMSNTDALGYAMQFIPALFGALLIFPVYYLGETLFNKKAGLIAALLIALIPIQIGSGHGSAFTLFDHDSINLLLFFLTFLFLVKGLKETDMKRSILYSLLSGLSLASLAMIWVEAQFIFTVIAIYAIVQMIVDIITKKMELRVPRTVIIILFSGWGLSFPVIAMRSLAPDLSLYLCIVVLVFGLYYLFLQQKKTPWIISLSAVLGIGAIGYVFLYFIRSITAIIPVLSPLERLSDILRGTGIYGNKVSETIAEAGTYSMSRSVMSYGPALYWLGFVGFVFLMYYFAIKTKWRRDYLFIIVLFIVEMWLAGTAGRFLNDSVPLFALLGGWIIWIVVDKLQYKQMWRNIRNAGGGLHGLRKGMKVYHVFGILFVAFLVILPNAYLALDAAVPSAATKNGTSNMKIDFFGANFSGAFGSSLYKEVYWVHAFSWLNNQDNAISDPVKRPAFISWWDYGFYASAVSGHPTVADNFQDGIPTASNFHTSTSEKEAVAVLAVRLLEGNIKDNKYLTLSDTVITVLEKHVGINNTVNITNWLVHPSQSPSYLMPIGAQYDVELSKQQPVGEQWLENAYYHDIVRVFNDTLTDEGMTWLYHDLQNTTGYSIRYYGVEGYDRDIFNIFAFLADKSNILPSMRSRSVNLPNPEDDFIKVIYTGYNINQDGSQGAEGQWTASDLNNMTIAERRYISITNTAQIYKDDYFNTMFYRTYLGTPPQKDANGYNQYPDQQLPCYGMIHFYPEYISPYPYSGAQSAVIIAKYYEGAFINGSLTCNNTPLPYASVVTFDDFGIPHVIALTDEQGKYSVLVPGGNVTMQFSYNYNELTLKEIRFNSTTNTSFRPITEDEAMRKTNYTRLINFTVNLSSIEGYAYQNNNKNSSYEPGVDSPLSNIRIVLTDEYFGRPVNSILTDSNGYYKFTGLYPSKYTIIALENGFEIYNQSTPISPDNHFINISKPLLAGVKGTIYYDTDKDTSFTAGEEMSGVSVKLIYARDGKLVNSMTTDATGTYAFSSLIPGNYLLNASVLNSLTGYYNYLTEQPITLEENKTSSENISIEYATINIQGVTANSGKTIGNVPIIFSPDYSVNNNTAQQITVTADNNGLYTGKLQPGQYNVSVVYEGENGSYSFIDKLSLGVGQGVKTYNILLVKQSITITGSTTYNGLAVNNVTLYFDLDNTVENNTGHFNSVQSNLQGTYIAEIMPGAYVVTAEKETTENGVNVTYSYRETITFTTQEINTGKIYNILLKKE